MTIPFGFALILAFIWGIGWARALQTFPGRFLAARLTWLSVVIGIGVDLAILLLIIPFETLVIVTAVIGLSAIPIIGRSILNEIRDQKDLHGNGKKDKISK